MGKNHKSDTVHPIQVHQSWTIKLVWFVYTQTLTRRGGEGIGVVYLGFGCRWGAQAAGVYVIPLLGTAPRWRATRQWRRGGWWATRALHESVANGGVLDVDAVAHLSGAGASMATATRQGSEGVRETRSHGRWAEWSRPCLVSKIFQDSLSHRILWHMHEA